MNGLRMIASHGDRHAPDTTRKCTTAKQATTMQRFDARAFIDPEFPQSLRLAERKSVPFHLVYEGRLAQRQLM